MIVIALTQQVLNDSQLVALTEVSLSNQQIIWHNGNNCAYMYFSNATEGDFKPTDQTNGKGYWVKDGIKGLTLDEYKSQRYSEIDAKTSELILQGYTYATILFSFSENAQRNLLGEFAAKDSLSYPFNWNSKDDLSTYVIQDATDMTNLFLTALGSKKSHQDSGTTLKVLIREAVNEAAVKAIIDNR